ncbi:cuticle protein CP14.6-like isoform X2 [Coccinella septempunctata]|uniref:cuticle protein CP14.6-like isoform X2 n=1 Tax=Coccinella septempunctata TaxID=41139 RepID=UPI001D0714F7|nr:cuticle protein CP14.6-like isoform X2 [Coccinella septempunctata]
MMKRLSKLFFILTSNVIVLGAPTKKDADATITSYDYKLTENGYFFEYSTSNGITRTENGVYAKGSKINDGESNILHVSGSYSYVDDKGQTHRIDYEANENGFLVRKPPELTAVVTSLESAVAFLGEEYEEKGPQYPKRISSAALASLSG